MIECPPVLRAIWDGERFHCNGNTELLEIVRDWSWYCTDIQFLKRNCTEWRTYEKWPKNIKFARGVADSVLAFEERWA